MTPDASPAVTAYIALGSNKGDKLLCIEKGIALMSQLPGTRVVDSSCLYSTLPCYDHLSSDSYLNCAVRIETTLPVEVLWMHLSGVETLMGPKDGRNAPRFLDLDISFFGERRVVVDLIFFGKIRTILLSQVTRFTSRRL